VAVLATLSAPVWREPLAIDIVVLVLASAGAILAREIVRWAKRVADRPDPSMIIADAAMAVALLAVVGDSAGPVGWIAMVLPVMEALVWSGVIAAGLTWVSVGGLYVVLRTMGGAETDVVLLDLLGHVGGSLLIAVPAWAAGTVIARELNSADHTRNRAEGRARQIEALANVGHRLASATTQDEVLDLLAESGTELGFVAADVVRRDESGVCHVERLAGRFEEGPPRVEWLIEEARDRGVASTNRNRDVQALHRCGLRSGVAARVTDKTSSIIVRLWRIEDARDGVDDRELARTLANQAAVAWHHAAVRDELEGRARTLAHDASHDALTGLANRNGLMSYLDTVGYEMRGQLALLYIDLDGFKAVNDTLGHDVGDEVLRVVAHRVGSTVGSGFVARLGGDEFVVALGVDSIDMAAGIGDRIVASLEHSFETAPGAIISCSVGVSLVAKDADVHSMMRSADQAMYAAKRAGGGRVAAARPTDSVNPAT